LRTNGHAVFEGDSIAFMVSVYRDETLPLSVRMQAAAIATQFERPRLQATALRVEPAHFVEDAREKLLTQLDRLQRAGEEELIERARLAFAGIKQDRVYCEPDVLPAVKPAAAPARQPEPVVVDIEPVKIKPAVEPPIVPLRPLSEQYRHLIRRY
jgi:hypothetical protein